jgi:hypothetical protein
MSFDSDRNKTEIEQRKKAYYIKIKTKRKAIYFG